jgi:hypothetical protein
MTLTSAFVSFVSCLDACLDAVSVWPLLMLGLQPVKAEKGNRLLYRNIILALGLIPIKRCSTFM